MSNYSALKTDINNNIYENNTQQITGTVLNTVLKDMVNTLGAGYQFAGCAYLDLNPGAPDAKVFYLAGEGLYTNFDNIQVPAGKLGILKWDTRWRLETIEGLGGGGANLTGYISVASTDDLPDEGQPTIGYLCGTNLYLYVGEGGDTKDGKYQNCGGFRGPEGVGITEIEQVEQSTENGGRNTIRITLSNGSSYDVYTRNGTTSTGLFPTLSALQAAYPNPVVGQYAFVGAGFPADIYVCNTAGTWTDSGADYDGDSVDLTNYATKAELNQLEAEVDGINSEVEQSPTYTPCRYVNVNGAMSALDSGTTYAYCQPIDFTGVTSIRVRGVLNTSSFGGIFFSNNSAIPTSSIQAEARVVRAYYGTTSTSGNVNDEKIFDAETLNELRGLGAKYIYVGVYQAGQKEMVFITDTPGLEDRVQELEETIGIVPAISQEVADTKGDVELLGRENGTPFELNGYYNQSGVFVSNSTFRATKPFSLEGITKLVAIYTAYAGSSTNVVYYDEDMNFLSYGVWGARMRKELTPSDFPNGAKYAAFSTFAVYLPNAMVIVNDVYSQDERIRQLISWQDRVGVCYGDSITAQGNNGVSGYVGVLNREILFSALYGRGVGGQSYVWNNGGWYTEVGTNGAYLDRYQYDSEGNKTNLLIPADATAEQISNIESALGKTIEVHRGCFCSWDRITTMIPASIRENVDLIILMGGTNDFASNYALGSGIPGWSSENTTDTDWVADTDFYNGGDYDLSTFSGGLMSTIMKMTVWCPNAVIVVVAPWGNYNTTTKAQTENGNGNIIQQFADREKEMAEYLGCPFINISAEAGVNPFNAATYFADGYHPNSVGARLIARVLIGGLRRIPARLI